MNIIIHTKRYFKDVILQRSLAGANPINFGKMLHDLILIKVNETKYLIELSVTNNRGDHVEGNTTVLTVDNGKLIKFEGTQKLLNEEIELLREANIMVD